MPFESLDNWYAPLYNNILCPKHVIIPAGDESAWDNNPGYRWVFNKINICSIQGIECNPHGIYPKSYPVFSKPIYNLWGMGIGSRKINNRNEMKLNYMPGHFWMELLEGEHISLDLVLIQGKPNWWSRSIGVGANGQTFDYWRVNIQDDLELQDIFDISLLKHFNNYTGHLNIEIIGGKVIEIHPRLSGQFVIFYGKKWLESIVSVYEKQEWHLIDSTTSGYSVPLFMDSNIEKIEINQELVDKLKNNKKILDIQVCVDSDGYINGLAGNRIAMINSLDLDEALKIREILKENILL